MSVTLPGFVTDVRMPIAGDSFGWAGVEPTAAKKTIVIHHSASRADASGLENAYTIANYHVNHLGWGGIGYHFVITHDKDGPVQIQYAGDLATWRAHVVNQNPGRVGICLTGNFETELPGENQLKAARMLIDYLLAPNNVLPSMSYYSQVTYHNAVPGQSTGCPGHAGAHFSEWMSYLQGNAFPQHLYTPPAPVAAPPVPEPIVAPEPAVITPSVETPQPVEESVLPTPLLPYQETYLQYPQVIEMATADYEGFAVDMTGQGNPQPIAPHRVIQVAGEFTDANGKKYYRTKYNVETGWPKLGQWYGVPAELFPTGGQPEVAAIPVVINEPGTVVQPDAYEQTGSILGDTPPVIQDIAPPAQQSITVAALPFTKLLAWVLEQVLRLLKIKRS